MLAELLLCAMGMRDKFQGSKLKSGYIAVWISSFWTPIHWQYGQGYVEMQKRECWRVQGYGGGLLSVLLPRSYSMLKFKFTTERLKEFAGRLSRIFFFFFLRIEQMGNPQPQAFGQLGICLFSTPWPALRDAPLTAFQCLCDDTGPIGASVMAHAVWSA